MLGLCLGMQLLFERQRASTRAPRGSACSAARSARWTRGRKLPHIGWNLVRRRHDSPLTEGLGGPGRASTTCTRSSRQPADDDDVVAAASTAARSRRSCERGNVMGAQFHPEKSST